MSSINDLNSFFRQQQIQQQAQANKVDKEKQNESQAQPQSTEQEESKQPAKQENFVERGSVLEDTMNYIARATKTTAPKVSISNYSTLKKLGIELDVKSLDTKKDTSFTYTFKNNQLTITAKNCQIDINSITNDKIEVIFSSNSQNSTLNSNVKVKQITNNGKNMTIIGSDENDNIINKGANSSILTGKGDDKVTNSAANAYIETGDGNDTVKNSGKDAVIYDTEGDNNISNTSTSAEINGLKYNKGNLLNGKVNNKMYTNGTLANGFVSGLMYQDGVALTGSKLGYDFKSGKLYINNKLATGTYMNNIYFKSGVAYTGTVSDTKTGVKTTYANGVVTKKEITETINKKKVTTTQTNFTFDKGGNITGFTQTDANGNKLVISDIAINYDINSYSGKTVYCCNVTDKNGKTKLYNYSAAENGKFQGTVFTGSFDGKYYDNGTLANGQMLNGKMYQDGVLADGLISVQTRNGEEPQQLMYKDGVIANEITIQGKMYANGIVANEVKVDGKMYKDGVLASGLVEVPNSDGDGTTTLMYENGIPANKNIGGILYENGVPFNGTKKVGQGNQQYNCMYKDGIVANEVEVDGKMYKNGKLFSGVNKEDNKLYNNGELFTGFNNNINKYGNGLMFKDGIPANDIIDGILYKDGREFTGTNEADGLYYKNGRPYNGEMRDFVNGHYVDIFYQNGSIANGIVKQGNVEFLYKDGIKFTGEHEDGLMYLAGQVANYRFVDNKFCVEGKLANGTYSYMGNKKLYVDGLPANSEIDGIMYYNGVAANNIEVNGTMYQKGLPANATIDKVTYRNGKPYQGLKDGTMYKEGNLANEIIDNKMYKDGKLANEKVDGIMYQKGLPANAIVGEILYKDGLPFNGYSPQGAPGYNKFSHIQADGTKVYRQGYYSYPYKDGMIDISQKAELTTYLVGYPTTGAGAATGLRSDKKTVEKVNIPNVDTILTKYYNEGLLEDQQIYCGRMCIEGKLANETVEGKLYRNGLLYNGINDNDNKMYKDGELANATINNKLYKDGELFNGEFDGHLYQEGKYVNGEFDGTMYYGGIPSSNIHSGKKYVNGKLAEGEVDGFMYSKGLKVNGDIEGIKYVNGKPANGTISNKMYQDGILANGMVSGNMYQQGVLATGEIDGILYKNGTKFTGAINGVIYYKGVIANSEIDGRLYENGKSFNGTIDGKLYQNGLIANGYVNGKYYTDGVESEEPQTITADETIKVEDNTSTGQTQETTKTDTTEPTNTYPIIDDSTYDEYGVRHQGSTYYFGDSLADGQIGDKYYESGVLANGQVDDVIYDNGVVFSDAAENTMNSIQNAIPNAIANDDSFKAFMESTGSETTFTSLLSFNIGDKVGSANVTIDKQGNVLEVKDGLLITYTEPDSYEIQNKEIFEINGEGIWNYTKENYGADFAGNNSLLLSLSATNETKSLNGISGTNDVNGANAANGADKVNVTVNSQAAQQGITIAEVQKFVTNGAQNLQNEAKPIEDKYRAIQKEKIDEMTDEANKAFNDAMAQIDTTAVISDLTRLPNSAEKISSQQAKVDNLKNALDNLEKGNAQGDINQVRQEYENAAMELGMMKMDNEMKQQLIDKYNNGEEIDDYVYDLGNGKKITYSRMVFSTGIPSETFTLEYGDTKITLNKYSGANDSFDMTVGNENSLPYTKLHKDIETGYLSYEYKDVNGNKKIDVTNKLTTIDVTTYNNDNTETISIQKGEEKGTTIDKCMISKTNIHKVELDDGYERVTEDSTETNGYEEYSRDKNGDLSENWAGANIPEELENKYYTKVTYMGEEKISNDKYFSDIDGKTYDNDRKINFGNTCKENYRERTCTNDSSDKKYVGEKTTFFDGTNLKTTNETMNASTHPSPGSCSKIRSEYVLGKDKEGNDTIYLKNQTYERLDFEHEIAHQVVDENVYTKITTENKEVYKDGVVVGTSIEKEIKEYASETIGQMKITTTPNQETKEIIQANGHEMTRTVNLAELNKPDGIITSLQQNEIGDCYLLSTMALLSKNENMNFSHNNIGVDENGNTVSTINWQTDGSCIIYMYNDEGILCKQHVSKEDIEKSYFRTPGGSDIKLANGDPDVKAIEIAAIGIFGWNKEKEEKGIYEPAFAGGNMATAIRRLTGKKYFKQEQVNIFNPRHIGQTFYLGTKSSSTTIDDSKTFDVVNKNGKKVTLNFDHAYQARMNEDGTITITNPHNDYNETGYTGEDFTFTPEELNKVLYNFGAYYNKVDTQLEEACTRAGLIMTRIVGNIYGLYDGNGNIVRRVQYSKNDYYSL